MEFKGQFLQVLRERDPKLFMSLRKSGQLDQYVQEKGLEANRLLRELVAAKGNDPASLREAEEQVKAIMFDLPVPEQEQNPEPPDDLPMPRSKARTSASPPAR